MKFKNGLILFILGLILGIFVINKFGWNFIQNWKLEYHQIVVEYLKIFLNYPAVLLIVSIIFFTKFSTSIDYFIRNLRIKYKEFEAFSQQAKNISPDESLNPDALGSDLLSLSKQDAQEIAAGIENLKNDSQTKQGKIDELQEVVTLLANRAEYFEFRYLNSVLIENTKLVLRDLYNIGSINRDLLLINIFVPANILDKYSEKLAIYNALLVNGLIFENGSLISVTEKGERYLRSINLIK